MFGRRVIVALGLINSIAHCSDKIVLDVSSTLLAYRREKHKVQEERAALEQSLRKTGLTQWRVRTLL